MRSIIYILATASLIWGCTGNGTTTSTADAAAIGGKITPEQLADIPEPQRVLLEDGEASLADYRQAMQQAANCTA